MRSIIIPSIIDPLWADDWWWKGGRTMANGYAPSGGGNGYSPSSPNGYHPVEPNGYSKEEKQ